MFSIAILHIVEYNIFCLGSLSNLDPPFLIPNKVVKQIRADDTRAKADSGESRSPPRRFFLVNFICLEMADQQSSS